MMKRLAVDPHAFRHLCFAEKPTSWPVSKLYGEIMSPASSLQALYNTCVTELTLCQQSGGEVVSSSTLNLKTLAVSTAQLHNLLCRPSCIPTL